MSADVQAAVAAEALAWIGTPYRHQASLKGVGCDCLGLVRGVWRAVIGEEPERPPPYTADWAEAGGVDALFDAATRHMSGVPLERILPGDVLLFRWRPGVPAKHVGILVAPDRFVHAQENACVAPAPLGRWWRAHLTAAFRFPDP